MSENLSLLDLIEQAIASLEVALPARNQTAVQLQNVLARQNLSSLIRVSRVPG